jgi:L-rhamnose mutarotase
VQPGRSEEYARRHAEVWPDIERLLRSAGVRTYTVYLWGEIVFSHMELPDYERLIRIFDTDPVAQRWEREFADLLLYPNSDPATGWPERLRHVWSLDVREGT